jgi:hypothetical protein
MSVSAAKALGALIPVCMLLSGALVLFLRTKAAAAILQLLGAASLTVVVLAHVAETFSLVPWMEWGLPDSAGHYFDLASVVLGLTLFPLGYLWQSLMKSQD